MKNLNEFETYKKCPKCGELISLDIYFGAYICKCGYWDDEYNKIRRENFLKEVHKNGKNRDK